MQARIPASRFDRNKFRAGMTTMVAMYRCRSQCTRGVNRRSGVKQACQRHPREAERANAARQASADDNPFERKGAQDNSIPF
jgi:hypothetical protein